MAKAPVSGRVAWVWRGLIAAAALAAIVGMITATAQSDAPLASAPSTSNSGTAKAVDKGVLMRTQNTDDERAWEKILPAATAIADVIELFPDDFSYSEYTPTGFLVAFAGEAPAAALTRLEEPGIPFEIVEHVGHPIAEVEAETSAMATQVRELAGGSLGFTVSPIPKMGVLEITLFEGNDAARSAQSLAGLKSPSGLEVIVKTAGGSPQTAG